MVLSPRVLQVLEWLDVASRAAVLGCWSSWSRLMWLPGARKLLLDLDSEELYKSLNAQDN